ncbi:MAG TPA: NAD(P)-dependent oxidoreductase [Casimicrobiaceae bacterium]|nr:NAD(P)-dependent oxidoreductase [Casimicrobiaceae bacterium]
MSQRVLCLRPQADFARVGVAPPEALDVTYRAPGEAEVPALMHSVQALVIPAVGPKLDAALFADTPLQIVQVTGAGVDRLDRTVLLQRGIPVCNVPGGSNAAVAEYAVTVAATLLRRFAWSDAEIHAGNYVSFRQRLLADNVGGLEDLVVGVVGLGTIGKAVARAFAGAGCRIGYHDPALTDVPALPFEAQAMTLDDLLRSCDVITLHVPLVDATRKLIDARALSLMKRDAILINAARGGVVDEAALADALRDGRLGGAAMDVYSTEPPDRANPLLALTGDAARRLLLTPHVAGVTRQSSAYLFREAWRNVARVLIDREAPLNRVY